MKKSILIKDIKNIGYMEFSIPSKPAVYVLTGNNGSGKTTLLTCLLRIGNHRAFQDYFNPGSSQLDSYNGEIVYSIDQESVSYHYAGSRWPPIPRSNSKILSAFGFSEVRFLTATGRRLFIHEQYINQSHYRPVEKSLKDDMNSILETDKFSNMLYVQTGSSRGPGGGSQRWKRAYVIKINRNTYYSEKNFSLGEIIILNTLLAIRDVPEQSMLLIDELEIALHPRAQLRLLRYLEKKAEEKHLTIMLSTHSSSLIKSSKNLIYLENKGNGNIRISTNCYPAIVLREIAIEDDIQPDYVFMVEDDMAEKLLTAMIDIYFKIEESRIRPIIRILPIGGYENVLQFAKHNSNYLFSNNIGQYVFLDNDVKEVKTEIARKGNRRNATEQRIYELFTELDNVTEYLPITPELGLWQWLNVSTAEINSYMQEKYDCTRRLSDLIEITNNKYSNDDNDTGGNRKKSKRRIKHLMLQLGDIVNENEQRITQNLFSLYTKMLYEGSTGELKSVFNPIFNRRGANR